MRRLFRLTALVAGLSAGVADAVHAQGSIGGQGYGYPTGQLSSAALGIGGAIAEHDAASPLNPAAIGSTLRYSLYMQFEPEFRRTSGPSGDARSSIIRFPNFMATGSIRRVTLAVSFSTLLDRTWSNTYSDSQNVGGEMFPSTLNASSAGAMNDTRFAAAYTVNANLQLGVGLHAISGENRLGFGRTFPESTGIGGVQQSTVLNFSGRAMSAGAVFQPVRGLVLGASARFGGPVNAERDGSPLAEATVPSRYGVGVTWFGIPNTTLAARYDRTTWSDLQGLGSAQMSTFDASELGLGVDVSGPRVGGAASVVRMGFRARTLPFGVDGEQVKERAFSGGVSVPVSRGRGQIDLTLQRAARSAGGSAGGVNERGWFLALGLGIRP